MHEVNNIINGKDKVNYIKALSLRWFGYTKWREQDGLMRKITNWTPM